MKIDIISVGKLKEDFVLKGIKHYQKPLSKFAQLNLLSVKAHNLPDNASGKDRETAKQKEGDALEAKAKPSVKVALSPEGKKLSSEAFAQLIEHTQTYDGSKLTFFIGGSYGLSSSLKTSCDHIISLSPLTFPHQLTALILSEQLFRAYKIINNETYHK